MAWIGVRLDQRNALYLGIPLFLFGLLSFRNCTRRKWFHGSTNSWRTFPNAVGITTRYPEVDEIV